MYRLLKGEPAHANMEWGGDADAEEREVAFLLQQVWFAALVGWSGGLHDVDTLIHYVKRASARLLPEDGVARAAGA